MVRECEHDLPKHFKLRQSYCNRTLVPNTIWPHGYDSAWALALTLNKSVEVLKNKSVSNGTTWKLENFTYKDREMARLFFNLLKNTEFEGLTVGAKSWIVELCISGMSLYNNNVLLADNVNCKDK